MKLAEIAEPIVIVAADQQPLPELPNSVRVIRDAVANQGPLSGFLTGLRYVQNSTTTSAAPDGVWLTSCDAPFCKPEVIGYLSARLVDHQAVVVRHQGCIHPLAGCYRLACLTVVEDLFRKGERRLREVAHRLNTCVVDSEDLRYLDPSLSFLCSVNTPEEFAAAKVLYQAP